MFDVLDLGWRNLVAGQALIAHTFAEACQNTRGFSLLEPSACAYYRHCRAHCTDISINNLQRTWLDLGDIAYRQGPGCFHLAAEAYRGALQRAGDLFPPDQQVEYNPHSYRTPMTQGIRVARTPPTLVGALAAISMESECDRAKCCPFSQRTVCGIAARSFSSASLDQESIAFRIAKCFSRCGDKAAAVAAVEQLLYTRNFWSERYRFDISLLRALTFTIGVVSVFLFSLSSEALIRGTPLPDGKHFPRNAVRLPALSSGQEPPQGVVGSLEGALQTRRCGCSAPAVLLASDGCEDGVAVLAGAAPG